MAPHLPWALSPSQPPLGGGRPPLNPTEKLTPAHLGEGGSVFLQFYATPGNLEKTGEREDRAKQNPPHLPPTRSGGGFVGRGRGVHLSTSFHTSQNCALKSHGGAGHQPCQQDAGLGAANGRLLAGEGVFIFHLSPTSTVGCIGSAWF